MRLWQIVVPSFDNMGRPYRSDAFLSRLIDDYGGYTVIPGTSGAWRDDAGKLYQDRSLLVQFMGSNPGPAKLAFSQCFPDQKALALASIGDMEIITL